MRFTKDLHYSLNIEDAVIGACLLEKSAFGRVYQILEPENFYNQFNNRVYETLKSMYYNGIPIDSYTLIDQFTRVQKIQKFGLEGVEHFILRTTNCVVSSAHIEYHAYILKSMWMEREIIKLTNNGYPLEGDTRQKISEIQQRIAEIQTKSITHDWYDMTQLMVDLYKHQELMKKTEGVGLLTGIKSLDRINGGFHAGQMIVIGARPSMGKSALAGSMAIEMAKNKKVVGIISLEMSNNEIAARLAAIDTNTDFNVLFRGLYRDEYETLEVYKRIGNHTSTLPIYVSDKTDVDIVAIKSKADKLKALHGLDCLIIDYLQLVDVPETYGRNRENEIARISRYCKLMAKDMQIPVVLLCQLNREVTKRKGEARYPMLSDIRESGSIEQDADVVMFLHRDWMIDEPENEQGESTEFQADLCIRKWRNGKNNFRVPLDFDPPKMRFTERVTNGFKPISVGHDGDNPF